MFDFLKRRRNNDDHVEPAPPPKGPPFPYQQIIVLSLCRITEPIAFCSIFPYAFYMVLSFGITNDESKVAIYAGMITSIFTFCEFAAGIFWGKMSDTYGRKPVLIIGLFGTGLSMLIFGFAKSLPLALIARGIGGALNGNVGVLQTAVAEVVTVKAQQPLAFAIMPFVWSIGAIIGSCLGGALADPVRNYPGTFHEGTIWHAYPFLLPNLIAAIITIFGMLNGFFFLNETNDAVKDKRDIGREMGHWITRNVRGIFGYGFASHRGRAHSVMVTDGPSERAPLLHDGSYGTNGTMKPAKQFYPTGGDSAIDDDDANSDIVKTDLVKTFNGQVLAQIAAYGILAYHTIAYDQILPVMLSLKEDPNPPTNIIKFSGGYGLPTSSIGVIMAAQGFYQIFFQIFLYAPIVYSLGTLRCFRWCAVTYPIIYFITPYTVLLPNGWPRYAGLGFCLFMKVSWCTLAYPTNALLLTNAAPSYLVLGTINGVAASVASLCRCVGPILSGVIESMGLDYGYSGISWWISGLVAVAGAIQCFWMTEEESPGSDVGPMAHDDDMWERESILFRRGSVAVNVSSTTEASIVESQLMGNLIYGGTIGTAGGNIRRMSMASHRRPSISGSIASQRTTATARQQIISHRERSVSTVSRQANQATPSRNPRDNNPSTPVR